MDTLSQSLFHRYPHRLLLSHTPYWSLRRIYFYFNDQDHIPTGINSDISCDVTLRCASCVSFSHLSALMSS